MSKKFLVSLDLNKNELLNARLQNLSSDPSSPVAGQIYYNTQENVTKFYDGSQWVSGGSTQFGLEVNRPEPSKSGTIYVATDTKVLYLDNGSSWIQVGIGPDTVDILTNKTLEDVVLKDRVSFTNNNDDETMYIEHSFTGTNRIVSNDDISIRSQNGDIILYPGNDDGGPGKAYVHWGDDNWGAYPDREITTAGNTQNITNKTVMDELGFGENGSFINGDAPNPGDLQVVANQELTLRSYNSNIILSPDNNVQIQSDLYTSNRIYAGNGLFVGGADYSNNGFIQIKDYNNNNVIVMGGDNGEGYFETHGYINLYTDYNSGGAYYGAIGFDGDNNLVINAPSNNLILQSDSGNAYMNSVSTTNRILTQADLEAVSSGLTWKQAANLLWDDPNASNSGLTQTLSIDGHATLTSEHNGYRILIPYGETAGIWTFNDDGTTWTLTRPEDADTNNELKGAAIFVMEGDQYGSTSWVQSNHYVGSTIDFADQDWHQFSGQGAYTGSNSIALNGTQINAVVNTESGLDINGSGIYVKTGYGVTIDPANGKVVLDTGSGFDTSSGALQFAEGYGVRKYTSTIGDNTATSFNLDHNFNTRHVTVQVFESAAPYAQVEVDVERTSTNRVTVKFASAPSVSEYEVVIVG